MRYFLFSIFLHLLLFLRFNNYKTLGNPNLSFKSSVPISYNVVNMQERIDNIRHIKGSDKVEPVVEETKKKKEEKKLDKKIEKDFESKMKNDKQKKEKKEKKEIDDKKIDDKAKQDNKDKKKQKPQKLGDYVANSDGSYTAFSAKGLDFKILTQVDPDYPRQAEIIRYSKEVVVEARFLVDVNGDVEKIEIIKSHEKFGFDKEVIASLKKWKFKPIVFNGKKMKVYFNKEFIFKPKI